MQILIFLTGILFSLCIHAQAQPPAVNAQILREYLADNSNEPHQKNSMATLKHFYSLRDYQPVWSESGQLTPRIDVALTFIGRADKEGLVVEDYDLANLQRLRREKHDHASLHLELCVTQALLSLIRDVSSGRLQASAVDPDWHIAQPIFDSASFLQQALMSDNLQQALAGLAPDTPQYHALRKLLEKFQAITATEEQWPTIPDTGTSIRPNTSHPVIPLIRQRIEKVHALFDNPAYAIPSSDSQFYDEALENAVKAFQQQHGLNADGVIGRHTRQAMNLSPQEYTQRLRINMERLRWLPRNLGDRHILVNIAGFTLIAAQQNAPTLEMRIVVGRDYRSTPSFSSHISHIVFNPYWNVPSSIASKDLLPKQKHDPDFFTSQGIKVYADHTHEFEIEPDMIDWHAVGKKLPYALRQMPGSKNALGRMKFMFSNPFSIYLHDTPSKALFKRDIRTFSSGCVRLEKPMELAEFSLGKSLQDAGFQNKLNSGKSYTVHLPERLLIYIVYLTAWTDAQGNILFSSDIYGRDKRALTLARWLE
ncbi:MAG: L,D-transpeptidase family protein [Nitrosomonas sp.]|nr:L,D-transpeptidase family protein [Nitrosomonas sp.]